LDAGVRHFKATAGLHMSPKIIWPVEFSFLDAGA